MMEPPRKGPSVTSARRARQWSEAHAAASAGAGTWPNGRGPGAICRVASAQPTHAGKTETTQNSGRKKRTHPRSAAEASLQVPMPAGTERRLLASSLLLHGFEARVLAQRGGAVGAQARPALQERLHGAAQAGAEALVAHDALVAEDEGGHALDAQARRGRVDLREAVGVGGVREVRRGDAGLAQEPRNDGGVAEVAPLLPEEREGRLVIARERVGARVLRRPRAAEGQVAVGVEGRVRGREAQLGRQLAHPARDRLAPLAVLARLAPGRALGVDLPG